MRFSVSLILLCAALSVSAQNWLVTFNGSNNAALPYYWPTEATHVGKDVPGKLGPLQIVCSRETIEQIKGTNAAALAACRSVESNSLWLASAPARDARKKVSDLLATNTANAASVTNLWTQLGSAGNVAGVRAVLTNLVKQVDATTQLVKELSDSLQKLYEQQNP